MRAHGLRHSRNGDDGNRNDLQPQQLLPWGITEITVLPRSDLAVTVSKDGYIHMWHIIDVNVAAAAADKGAKSYKKGARRTASSSSPVLNLVGKIPLWGYIKPLSILELSSGGGGDGSGLGA